MARARVRRLEGRDVPDAIRLTDLESWGYTSADFRRLLALSPEGCLALEEAGRLVGLLTTTPYGRVAYLGAVILDPAVRGSGLGRLLMETALDRLARSGVETVVLHAYLNVIPFYEKLGFVGETENVRWEGRADPGNAVEVRVVRPEDFNELVAFDALFFGARRDLLLRRLMTEFPDTFLLAHAGGSIVGYLVGNPSGASCEIGPWVVHPNHREAVTSLFRGLSRAAGAKTVAFSGPASNEAMVAFARERGFTEVFRTLRMARGPDTYRGEPLGLWAFAGLEKG